MPTRNFYRDISPLLIPVAEVLHPQYFFEVPADWYIIIADIQNSTAAVAAGKHNDVNLVAAGSLIAALNIAKSNGVEIPFFFSGDGGAILVPAALEGEVLRALYLHNDNASKNLGLSMHIGSISVAEIRSAGAALNIAKMQLGQKLHKALLVGDGLKLAETQIKKASRKVSSEPASIPQILNMAGLECRWDRVKPPVGENEIVCYLIDARRQGNQLEVYGRVMRKIDELYGSVEQRSPLSISRLKLLLDLTKMEKEMLIKYGRWKTGYLLGTLLQNLVGFFYFRFNLKLGPVRGQEYLLQLITNADTLTIDGRINTIISGKREKRERLVEFLVTLEAEGLLFFGHHISKESVVTCYIESMDERHIHFVDGSDGGYTEASKELKAKMRSA